MNHSKVKAKAIDTKKDKILYAGAALLLGLMAAVLFTGTAKAQTAGMHDERPQSPTVKSNKIEGDWTAHVQVHDEVIVPFQLKSQKLSH